MKLQTSKSTAFKAFFYLFYGVDKKVENSIISLQLFVNIQIPPIKTTTVNTTITRLSS